MVSRWNELRIRGCIVLGVKRSSGNLGLTQTGVWREGAGRRQGKSWNEVTSATIGLERWIKTDGEEGIEGLKVWRTGLSWVIAEIIPEKSPITLKDLRAAISHNSGTLFHHAFFPFRFSLAKCFLPPFPFFFFALPNSYKALSSKHCLPHLPNILTHIS